jgi:hypothetical protein
MIKRKKRGNNVVVQCLQGKRSTVLALSRTLCAGSADAAAFAAASLTGAARGALPEAGRDEGMAAFDRTKGWEANAHAPAASRTSRRAAAPICCWQSKVSSRTARISSAAPGSLRAPRLCRRAVGAKAVKAAAGAGALAGLAKVFPVLFAAIAGAFYKLVQWLRRLGHKPAPGE